MRRVTAVLVALAVAFGLSGCIQRLPEPLAFTVVDSVIIARTCVPLAITEQGIYRFVEDDFSELGGGWRAVGSVSLPAGSEFAVGQLLDGFHAVPGGSLPDFEERFAVVLQIEDGSQYGHTSVSELHLSDLAEGTWLNSDGEVIDTPCTQQSCDPLIACLNDWQQPTGYPTESLPTITPSPMPTREIVCECEPEPDITPTPTSSEIQP